MGDSGRECVMERENLCDNWPLLTGLIRSLNIYTLHRYGLGLYRCRVSAGYGIINIAW